MVASIVLFALASPRIAAPQARFGPATIPGFDVKRDFILTDREAIGMLAPRVVCPAAATSLQWSPDGAYLLVQKTDAGSMEEAISAMVGGLTKGPPGVGIRKELDVYSVRANKVLAVVPLGSVQISPIRITWLHGAARFVVEYDDPIRDASGVINTYDEVAALVSVGGQVRELARAAPPRALQVFASPRDPIVAIEEAGPYVSAMDNGLRTVNRNVQHLRLIRSDGGPATEVTLPKDYSRFDWGPDGNGYVSTIEPDDMHKRLKQAWLRVNMADGKLTPVDSIPKPGAPPAGPGFAVRELVYRTKLVGLASVPARAISLESATKTDAQMALVTADGAAGAISPNADSVAFISQGIAMVRPLFRMPKDVFLATRNAAMRAALMSQAKQVALAFLMNSGDYDNNFPNNTTDWQSSLGPYLGDPTLTDGFVYTFPGGNSADIQSPATTILGYIDGPGGRATAYADGHCKWIPN